MFMLFCDIFLFNMLLRIILATYKTLVRCIVCTCRILRYFDQRKTYHRSSYQDYTTDMLICAIEGRTMARHFLRDNFSNSTTLVAISSICGFMSL